MSSDDKKIRPDDTEIIEIVLDGDQSPVKGPTNTERDSSFVAMEQAMKGSHDATVEPESIEVDVSSAFEPKVRNNDSLRKAAKQVDEIEIYAVGHGFPDNSSVYTDGTSSSSSVSSADSCGSKKKKKRTIRPYTKIAGLIFAVCLIIGLAVGISKTSASKKQAANVAATSGEDVDVPETVDPNDEDSSSVSNPSEGGADVTDVNNGDEADEEPGASEGGAAADDQTDGSDTDQDADANNQTVSEVVETPPPRTVEETLSPTAGATDFGSEAGTVEDSTAGTGEACTENNVVATSTCQAGLNTASSSISFCFSATADGDWYWIRSTDEDTDYDSWEYTDGAWEGAVELPDLAPGNYKASIARDSMRPYDIISTADFTVPDCSTQ